MEMISSELGRHGLSMQRNVNSCRWSCVLLGRHSKDNGIHRQVFDGYQSEGGTLPVTEPAKLL